jgi:conjugative relaxase-like TrwC/TraI family protein
LSQRCARHDKAGEWLRYRSKVPGTKESLTVRTKDKRTAGYDFCYSLPKSVSVYLALSGDPVVERMIHEAFRETMVDVEGGMERRVRGADEGGNQRDKNRTTGNIMYAAFVHTVSRPIDGIPVRTTTFTATSSTPPLTQWKSVGRPDNS